MSTEPYPWIEDVQDLAGAAGTALVHLPDTATGLVFRTTAAGRADLVVVGPRTRAAYFAGKDLPVCVRFRLAPGAARAVLGVRVSGLVDRVTPLTALWGADAARLERRLSGADGDSARIAELVGAAVGARIGAQGGDRMARGRLARTATVALSAADRPVRLREVVRGLAISERHLRDLLTDEAGLPPKSFARIARLRTALAIGGRRPASLAQLAAAVGYYDQSHMTGEFRRLLGVPPGAFLAGRLPALQPC